MVVGAAPPMSLRDCDDARGDRGLGLTPFVTGSVPCFRSVDPGPRPPTRDQPDEQ
jgi:hypothetical protein